ncbi:SurA N-terminal domain-containing protein [Myxococcota bacterium]|nr:SurA N-terminal domain-containing protein [Myxococcota bacterium]
MGNLSTGPLRTLVLGTSLALAPLLVLAEEIVVDGIAAQVGSNIVLISEVRDMVGPTESQMRANGASSQDIAKLHAEGLERMIEWRLIEQIVKQRELYASDEEIDRAVDAIAQENGLTREELETSVAAAGLELADYRGQLKREIERSKVMGMMVTSQVEIDESEVSALYAERFSEQPLGGEEVHIRQLLVLHGGESGRTAAQACAITNEVRERVLAGAAFEELARADNAIVPERGGDIGWVHTNNLSAWMKQNLAPLKAGQLSDVTELPMGCNLLQLVDRRTYEFISFEQAKPRLAQELFAEKEMVKYREWMEEMRAETYIERQGHFADAAQLRAPADGAPASAP